MGKVKKFPALLNPGLVVTNISKSVGSIWYKMTWNRVKSRIWIAEKVKLVYLLQSSVPVGSTSLVTWYLASLPELPLLAKLFLFVHYLNQPKLELSLAKLSLSLFTFHYLSGQVTMYFKTRAWHVYSCDWFAANCWYILL